MGSWFAEAVAPPAPARSEARPEAKPKKRPVTGAKARPRRRARSRAAVVWIVVSAVLLAGVVFVNVAVLRLNLELDQVSQERAKLRGDNAALQSELSSALASPKIQALARRQNGLIEADPAEIGYIDLGG